MMTPNKAQREYISKTIEILRAYPRKSIDIDMLISLLYNDKEILIDKPDHIIVRHKSD